ncbi:hypothetical protein BCR34DRAFT_249488 [Clohesyomyces aquaticus]|uniref:Uncharacterized protein n=1 Tax=Clohesyomyces aquaticus TaxID=1231657 RepID=A0A1Y1ZW01_9PLEO|nr:hypothetical protein BCR34DRAFT_249488 [Clohesyomyces aquaticus]
MSDISRRSRNMARCVHQPSTRLKSVEFVCLPSRGQRPKHVETKRVSYAWMLRGKPIEYYLTFHRGEDKYGVFARDRIAMETFDQMYFASDVDFRRKYLPNHGDAPHGDADLLYKSLKSDTDLHDDCSRAQDPGVVNVGSRVGRGFPENSWTATETGYLFGVLSRPFMFPPVWNGWEKGELLWSPRFNVRRRRR